MKIESALGGKQSRMEESHKAFSHSGRVKTDVKQDDDDDYAKGMATLQ